MDIIEAKYFAIRHRASGNFVQKGGKVRLHARSCDAHNSRYMSLGSTTTDGGPTYEIVPLKVRMEEIHDA